MQGVAYRVEGGEDHIYMSDTVGKGKLSMLVERRDVRSSNCVIFAVEVTRRVMTSNL
jgi:hypothetical protein